MALRKNLMAAGFTTLLVACASPTVTEMKSPDGTSLKNVKCNIDSQKCFVHASQSCATTGGTYRVVSSHSNAGGTLADILPGPVTWYNMTYVCGPSDGQMPAFPFKGQQYIPPASTTTNCTRIGDRITCRSY